MSDQNWIFAIAFAVLGAIGIATVVAVNAGCPCVAQCCKGNK